MGISKKFARVDDSFKSHRNLKMVSESSEGRALPQNVNGRYDASEERHLARLVTKASQIQHNLPLNL